MRTSEALNTMYIRMNGQPPDKSSVDDFREKSFNLFAQAPQQGQGILDRLMFEVPAYVLWIHKTDPSEAKASLMRAIAGAQAWEEILAIESASPTKEQFEKLLSDIGFYELFG